MSSIDQETTDEYAMAAKFLNKAVVRYPDRHLVFLYGTLKRGQPNYHVMTNEDNGKADYICKGVTVDKYPLVIGSRYNIPYLMAKKGIGHQITGELFAVDNKMLHFLDDFEGHPTYYMRNHINALAEDDKGHRVPIQAFKPWIYMLERFKPEMLDLPYHSSYDSYGPHGLKYVESDPTHGVEDM